MRKHYGQVVKTCIKIAFASALLLIISGVLSYAIKGKVIAILEIIAGIIAFCAVIFIRNKRNESVNNFLEIMAKSSNSISANIMDSFPIPIVVVHIDGSICWYNGKFSELFFNKDLFDTKLENSISDIKWGCLLYTSDTMRVSLTANPVEEIYAAYDIQKVLGMRKTGAEIVSCPTCGRTQLDLISIANEVEKRAANIDKPIKIAVMGCAVNGPGEAREADIGIAGGKGEGLIFKKGEIIKKVPQDRLVDELMKEIETL